MTGQPGKLPARDFEEIRLAEALERGRCPVCDARQEATYAALRGLAREGATDRGLRDQMDKGLGFCQPHSVGLSKMELLQTSSQLATAVLLDAVLRRRLAALDEARRQRRLRPGSRAGRARRSALPRLRADIARHRARPSGDSSSCPRMPAWSAALGAAEICLDDLYALWAAAVGRSQGASRRAGRRSWPAQLRRLEALQKTLAEYAHNSTSDRRHLITPEQQEAGAASIRFFGGTPDRDRQR